IFVHDADHARDEAGVVRLYPDVNDTLKQGWHRKADLGVLGLGQYAEWNGNVGGMHWSIPIFGERCVSRTGTNIIGSDKELINMGTFDPFQSFANGVHDRLH